MANQMRRRFTELCDKLEEVKATVLAGKRVKANNVVCARSFNVTTAKHAHMWVPRATS